MGTGDENARIYVAGHTGLLGSAIVRALGARMRTEPILRTRAELDLTQAEAVEEFMLSARPDCVILAAAKVGGIQANIADPVGFLAENLAINKNVICSAVKAGVGDLIYIGSSCMYPRDYISPLREEYILAAPLEPTNEGYALAKIAGARLCEYCNKQHGTSYKTLIPCNLYGPFDKFSPSSSHLIAAAIDKLHKAKTLGEKQVEIWGDGAARREFLYVDDLAEFICDCLGRLAELPRYLNVGYGADFSVLDYYRMAADVIGYTGDFVFDTSKPVGMSFKLLDSTLARGFGWSPSTDHVEGISKTYGYYLDHGADAALDSSPIQSGVSAALHTYPLAASTWDEDELEAIAGVVESGRFTMGPRVREFERRFAERFGSRHAVMVNSGSSANLLAVAATRYRSRDAIRPGDEVIVPAVSWGTTYFPLHQYGLSLRLVDIDLSTLNMDLDQAEAAITDRTRAIFAVNILGAPNDFARLRRIREEHHLILLEDNCEAMGATYDGRSTGTFGLCGTFSTFFSHHICTMEGGVVTTDDDEIFELVTSLRAHGWTRELRPDNHICRKLDDPFHEMFRFVLPGYNVRPLEISAAVGIRQLEKLDRLLWARRRNAAVFEELFGRLEFARIQEPVGESSWFGFAIILDGALSGRRDAVVDSLTARGVECRPIVAGNFARSPAIRFLDHSVFEDLANADRVDADGFFLGNHHYDLTGELTLVRETLCEVAGKCQCGKWSM